VTFSSSGGLVRDLATIVEIPALPMFNTRQDFTLGGTIRSKFIRHDHSGHVAQTFKQLAKEALGRLRVAATLDQHIKHVAMLISGPPELVQFATDPDEHLIQNHLSPGRGRRHLRLLAQARPKRRLHSRMIS
jgi:hypothetical protein